MNKKLVLEAIDDLELGKPISAEMRHQVNEFLRKEAQAQLDAQSNASAVAQTAEEIRRTASLRDLMVSPKWAKMSELEQMMATIDEILGPPRRHR